MSTGRSLRRCESNRWSAAAAIVLGSIAALTTAPAYAAPSCQLSKFLEMSVMLAGHRPIVTTKIGGKDARFIVDSGAFYSTMSRASAAEFGLHLDPAPTWFRLRGVNGDTSASIASVRDFGLGGVSVPKVDFIVGGTDTGAVGLLGQNFLGIGDVEYDLPHGAIRLLHAKDCAVETLAYWAGTKPFTIVSLESRNPPFQVHTVGTVTLNGVKLRAVFDTGAESSIMTLSAARRAGITPDSPGVVASGLSTGLGSRALRTWIGTFDKLEIGGEAIPKPRIQFSDITIGDGDMLIGFDFFRTHRIYVANKANKMLVTYEGGPVFGLTPTRAVSADGTPLDLSDKAAEPTTAEGYTRRGTVQASNGKLEAALADLDKAVALAPNDVTTLRIRAGMRLANRQPLLASGDLDKAIALEPAEADVRLMRAGLKLRGHDPAGASEDLHVADKGLPPSSERRLQLASMLVAVDEYDAALLNFDAWLKAHPEDAARPEALNGRCWARALLNRDLDRALDDCNAAVRLRPGTVAYLDSRGLVRLRRGEFTQALKDYDAAIGIAPRSAWSLYARSIVRAKVGDAAGATADRAAAIALQPAVAERARKLGLGS
ncbi:aspartyl protease family protein [Glacieibacterium megasporae]|uniref:aspartyl protease family protein n=1 Tax=Glacieibacterium megasporae TaxID=2835787 RepID=UPI002103D84E|nr:aspartyl protease family protein [Polymorphobacter megasporae]